MSPRHLLTLACLLPLAACATAPEAAPAAADAVALPRAEATPAPGIRASRPRAAAINGGVAVLALPADVAGRPLYYNGQPVWQGRFSEEGPVMAVIGLGLDAAGEQVLLRQPGDSPAQAVLRFDVTREAYPEQRLTLAPAQDRYVHPDPEQLARFAREAAEQKAAYRVHTPAAGDARWPTFRWPLTGRLSSPFGLQRFFNDEPRAPHLGLDIEGRAGMTAVAPADGRVALTGDFFFNGRTVIIDHGQGLFSMLCHFQDVLVQPGETVRAGQPVGLVGATGRATGPHLHWTVSLNDARIDPRWLMPGD